MKSTRRTQALAAGISLIVMAIAAVFSYGYVLGSIEVQGDPAATYDQLIHHDALFRTSLVGWLLIFVTDLIVTVSLYLFFRETRKGLSLATATLRLVYTIILGIALIKLFSLLSPLNEKGIDAIQAGNQVLAALDSFGTIWSVGLIIFGLHLLGLGTLGLLDRKVPNIFPYLLFFAGVGYLVVHVSKTLIGLPENTVNTMETILMAPMALGEILLAIWLIVKGGK